MPRVNRAWLATRYRMIPGLVSSTIYRMSVADLVTASQAVLKVRFKSVKVIEKKSDFGPTLQKMAEIHLYSNELGTWVVLENDIIHVVDAEQKLDSWWRVDTVAYELLNTRANCMCNPTSALE